MGLEAVVLANALVGRTPSDVAYLSDLVPDQLDDLLEDRDFKIKFEKVRVEYRELIFQNLLDKGTGAQILELYLRSLPTPGKVEFRHPREVKEDEDGLPDEIIIRLAHKAST